METFLGTFCAWGTRYLTSGLSLFAADNNYCVQSNCYISFFTQYTSRWLEASVQAREWYPFKKPFACLKTMTWRISQCDSTAQIVHAETLKWIQFILAASKGTTKSHWHAKNLSHQRLKKRIKRRNINRNHHTVLQIGEISPAALVKFH